MASLGLEPGQPRSLTFSPAVRNDLRLVEVSEELLKEILDKGVVIKGREDEEAVLCTSRHTYAMKLVETTNLQLLVQPQPQGEAGQGHTGQQQAGGGGGQGTGRFDPGQGLMTQWDNFRAADSLPPVVVSATNTSHIELVEVAPRLGQLRQLLWRAPYGLQDEQEEQGKGEEGQGEQGGGAAGWTFDQLLDEVQASPGELRAALGELGAVAVGGRWRVVDPGYLGQLLEVLLLTVQQEGMPLTAVREEVVAAGLRQDGYRPELVRHCLKLYGTRVDEQGAQGQGTGEQGGNQAMAEAQAEGEGEAAGAAVWSLDERKVCVHFAHKVLAGRHPSPGGGLPLQDFTAAWRAAVPHGLNSDLDMLRAEALIEGSGPEARIAPFPAAALPADPAERFAALFAVRPRWQWIDLEPYLAGLKVPGRSVEALLMRHARASQPTPDAPLMYSAR